MEQPDIAVQATTPAPIETVYDGHRFRSRLEARWAFVFKSLGVPYEYEPGDFDLGADGWYLPDFYVLRWLAYIEIKPEWSPEAERKIALLAAKTGARGLLIAGQPAAGEYGVSIAHRAYAGRDHEFACCERCLGLSLTWPPGPDDPSRRVVIALDSSCPDSRWKGGSSGPLAAAFTAARSAFAPPPPPPPVAEPSPAPKHGKWRPVKNGRAGSLWRFRKEDGLGVTVFETDEGTWKFVHGGVYSQNEYESRVEALAAAERVYFA